MSVNVVLTRLEESGSAALQNSHAVFFFVVEMCHNTTSLCACMFACHIQSELRRVEVSVTGVGAHERVASFGCAAAGGRGNMCMCAFFGGRAGGVSFTSVEQVSHVTYLCLCSLLSLTNYS